MGRAMTAGILTLILILLLAVVITAVSLILADIWNSKIRKGFQKGKTEHEEKKTKY